MQQVPATDDFTITWPDPAMAESSWSNDRMHNPGPITPLAQHNVAGFYEDILGGATIFANGYQFSLHVTVPTPPPEVVANSLDVWHNDYAPRIRAFCEHVRNTDFDAMTTPEVAAALDPLADESLECLRLTMVVVSTFMQPTFAMLEFLEGELGADGPHAQRCTHPGPAERQRRPRRRPRYPHRPRPPIARSRRRTHHRRFRKPRPAPARPRVPRRTR